MASHDQLPGDHQLQVLQQTSKVVFHNFLKSQVLYWAAQGACFSTVQC